MTIKNFQEICHQIAVEKGFWNKILCKKCDALGEIFSSEWKICQDCEGQGYILDRNNGEAIALMHSELSEALEAIRQNEWENVAEELADLLIRVMDFCEAKDIDLETEIIKKIEKNKTRPYKHNKEF